MEDPKDMLWRVDFVGSMETVKQLPQKYGYYII
jgi:hypothetical protein